MSMFLFCCACNINIPKDSLSDLACFVHDREHIGERDNKKKGEKTVKKCVVVYCGISTEKTSARAASAQQATLHFFTRRYPIRMRIYASLIRRERLSFRCKTHFLFFFSLDARELCSIRIERSEKKRIKETKIIRACGARNSVEKKKRVFHW